MSGGDINGNLALAAFFRETLRGLERKVETDRVWHDKVLVLSLMAELLPVQVIGAACYVEIGGNGYAVYQRVCGPAGKLGERFEAPRLEVTETNRDG